MKRRVKNLGEDEIQETNVPQGAAATIKCETLAVQYNIEWRHVSFHYIHIFFEKKLNSFYIKIDALMSINKELFPAQ